MNFWGKFGHGLKVVAKDAAKIAAPAVAVASVAVPELTAVSKFLELATPKSDKGDDVMNPLEMMAITMIMGVLQTVIKNPAHKEALKTHLVGIADQIYMSYGLTPPDPSAAAPAQTPGK